MIVGNGLIAKAFKKVDERNVVFFASGVSNSLETDKKQFLREKKLVLKTLKQNYNKLFIYFSTCSIYDSSKHNSLYVNHKLNMEHIISQKSNNYLILRISNVVGKGGNPNLLVNYINSSIKEQKTINIHLNASRNLIHIDDVVNLTTILLKSHKNTIQNIAYPQNYSIPEIIESMEHVMAQKAIKISEEKGESYTIDTATVQPYFKEKNKLNKKEYILEMFKKSFT